jgi:SAM-dependent methyltransferase
MATTNQPPDIPDTPAPPPPASDAERVARLRPAYQAELADGIARFFEPRRTDCPWCGARQLRRRLRTKDHLQRKPGTFTLDQCRDCGHTFQNPQLSPAGLDFYYRDFYDGLYAEKIGGALDSDAARERNHERAVAMRRHARPKRWLDVGTAGGDFCLAAREALPGTTFDGLDIGAHVLGAQKSGRIERAYQGFLPDLADELAGQYDAVSMFHCLEHTTDPQAQLAAVHTVLRPGGHLIIEVPNPESPFGRLFGRYWLPWFQPQHQHFVTMGNLRRALTELGFTVVATDREESHIPVDFTALVGLYVLRLLPFRDEPWLPEPPGRLGAAVTKTVFWAGIPFCFPMYALDRLLAPLIRRSRFSNAFRVIARREE